MANGRGQGNSILQEYYPMSELQHERWVLHDQLGSNAACFDENGNQSDENTYDAWGQSFWTQVILDGHPRNVSSVSHDGGSGITSVTMAASFAIAIENAVIRVARPDEASGRLLYFDVLSTSGDNTILVQDDSSAFYDIVNADIRFTVLAFYNTVTGGTWYDVPVYNAGNDTTTFYGEAWHYGPTAALEEQGATLVPDVNKPVHLTILSITQGPNPNDDEIVVRGRADGLATTSDRFFIQVPPRFMNDPLDGSGADAYATPEKGGSLYLYAGYRYEMRRSGSGIQANTGWYYCWNRMYDPLIGRWSSPDPAATPWSNLGEYVSGCPIDSVDATGLGKNGAKQKTNAELDVDDADMGEVGADNDWEKLGIDANGKEEDFIESREKCKKTTSIDSVLFWDRHILSQGDGYGERFGKHVNHFTESHKYGIKSFKQLLMKMKALVGTGGDCEECKCVKKVTILGHGYTGGEAGPVMGGASSDDIRGEAEAKKFGRLIKNGMCKTCQINLQTCGSARSHAFATALAAASGCTVWYTTACYRWQQQYDPRIEGWATDAARYTVGPDGKAGYPDGLGSDAKGAKGTGTWGN